jgi:hypothetical protein
MADLVNRIKQRLPYECLKKGNLTKQGVTVSKRGAPKPSIAIDMDHKKAPVKQNETKCDYIFIGGRADVFLVPLELMKGKADVTKIVKQLQAGADIAAHRIIPKNKRLQFQPVAVCGEYRKQDARKLRQSRIRFRGERIHIEPLKCGAPLTNAVDFC